MARSRFTEDQALDYDFVSHPEMDVVSGTLRSDLDAKADSGHNHSDLYYTKSETDALLSTASGITISGSVEYLNDIGDVNVDSPQDGDVLTFNGFTNTWSTSSDEDYVSPDEHEGLHDKDTYIEITRENNKVSVINEWKDNTKVFQYSSTAVSRNNGKVSVVTKTIYDYETGTSGIATVTTTLNRTDNKVTSVTISRDNDMEGL